MDLDARIYIAGHRGMVGSALLRRLQAMGATQLLTRSRDELDLVDQSAVADFFMRERPEYVFLAAAKVGGIHANNTYPAEFIQQNLAIQTNIIHSAWRHGCRKLLFLGSSCIYPRDCPQPIRESYLLTGPLEPTNEAYAIAKIAGLKMCQAYRIQYGFEAISVMPTNLYGPGDNYHPENSHVAAALIRRFHEAKIAGASEVTVWGSGKPLREFLHVDDFADACLTLMQRPNAPEVANIGSGHELSVAELARLIAELTGYTGRIVFDPTKPDGTLRKRLDTSVMDTIGWHASTPLRAGLLEAINAFAASRH
ncbi:GDP-L-fucose synthase [Dyella flagellata]|uniref:GDP-L-fucose synthase n=2 Tax=Dyella flagellata TaxID=1867833 RepID=A0ABQ5XDL7_9GAMM|nr:GDP-L-fucose synthase [Dyella flagellata]